MMFNRVGQKCPYLRTYFRTYLMSFYSGGDAVDYIMSRMTDNSKSRRQVLRQLVHLELIGSAKELKKNRSMFDLNLACCDGVTMA